jgi:hypothetical protein
MNQIVTRKELDSIKCSCCKDTKDTAEEPIYFHPQCHPKAATWTSYYGGMLKVECVRCGETVVIVEVK